jgi:hypothetical protein
VVLFHHSFLNNKNPAFGFEAAKIFELNLLTEGHEVV